MIDLEVAVAELQLLRQGLPESPGQVHLRRSGAVAEVVLDHPAARQALSVAMMADLAAAVWALRDFTGSVIVVRSEDGNGFCAGGFLPEVRHTLVESSAAAVMTRSMTAVLDALRELPALSVARLQGPAIGGGVELALSADLRVAGTDAWLQLKQVSLGVAMGWGGASRLAAMVGRGRALELAISGRRVDAETALGVGLIDVLLPSAGDEAWSAWLDTVLRQPVDAVRGCKSQIAAAGDRVVEQGAFLSLWGGAAHRAMLG